MTNDGILWLHPPTGFTHKVMYVLREQANRCSLNASKITFICPHRHVKEMWIRKGKTKNKWIANPEKKLAFNAFLEDYTEKLNTKIIVVNDKASLEYICGNQSLDLCRGSVYFWNGIPCLAFDDFVKNKSIRHGPWLQLMDFQKLQRWHSDTQRPEPKFTYKVCRKREDLDEMLAFANESWVAAHDIETTVGLISCDGFSFLTHSGKVHSFVVPYIDPTQPMGCHWHDEDDEIYAHQAVAKILADERIVKAYQNGLYDSAYNIKYRRPQQQWWLDSIHLWHCIWTEAPKKLNFISSVLLDYCRFWKDEAKGDKKDADKAGQVPKQRERLERYWRYNALDTYNTLLNCLLLLRMHSSMDWALQNYTREFPDQIGPALAMSMRGLLIDIDQMHLKKETFKQEAKDNLHKLRVMVDDAEFNPKSSYQVASLIYDVLGIPPMKARGKNARSPRSVDKKILKVLKDQHWLAAPFIQALWDAKEPAANYSKYGNLRAFNGRFMTQLSASRTDTWRYASGEHQFRVGTNMQNIPYPIRDALVADPGYFLLSIDYSQSDGWFIAYHSQEENMIKNMLDPRDTHCLHAEFFFKHAYDKIYQGHLDEAAWVEDPITGVRQNTKRIVHGANFRMAGFTLFMTMGRPAVVSTAKALGHKNAAQWDTEACVQFCTQLLESYHHMYPGLRPWFNQSTLDAVKNGNRVTNAFGYTRLFFGDMLKDDAIQRELSAFYGQSGTSGNINSAMRRIYYETDLEARGVMMLLQVHDELLLQIPNEMLGNVNEILTLMKKPVTLHERTFTVPVDAKISYHWGRGMLKWHNEITLDDLQQERDKWQNRLKSGLQSLQSSSPLPQVPTHYSSKNATPEGITTNC